MLTVHPLLVHRRTDSLPVGLAGQAEAVGAGSERKKLTTEKMYFNNYTQDSH